MQIKEILEKDIATLEKQKDAGEADSGALLFCLSYYRRYLKYIENSLDKEHVGYDYTK